MTVVTPADPKSRARINRWLVGVAAVLMLTGLLFGYDQGVIAGALEGIGSDFDISTTVAEIITSWVTLGALFGALVAGVLADAIGRRSTIAWAGLLLLIGAALQAFAPATFVIVLGRLVVGVGVGAGSVAAPIYAAEMTPTHLRGRFLALFQLAVALGIFAAYGVDQLLSNSEAWRVMLGASAVPAVVLVVIASRMPRSPRWLLKRGREQDAARTLEKLDPHADVQRSLVDLSTALDSGSGQASWRQVLERGSRAPLLVGVGLAVFQQFTGINAVIFYADEIFADAGFATPQDQASAATWAIGAVNVLSTFVAVAFVDRFGRKPLLLTGLVGMGISLTVVGFCFLRLADEPAGQGESMAGIFTLVALVVFIASFAFSMGPVVWTVINEIFPNRVRSRGVAAATAANWASAWLVSQFFLTLTDSIGKSATFWLFAAFAAVAFAWIWRKVPETKGKSLEEIERLWSTATP